MGLEFSPGRDASGGFVVEMAGRGPTMRIVIRARQARFEGTSVDMFNRVRGALTRLTA